MANYFYSIAVSKELPPDSKNLKIILKNLEKLENYNSRKKYADRNLKYLSSGSSRLIYLTNKNTVIKLVKNKKGLAQNKVEANLKTSSKFINTCLNFSKDYIWIETNFLENLTEKEFAEFTGLNFKDFGEAIRSGLKNKDISDKFPEIKKSKIYKDIVGVGKKYKLMGGDIARISNWRSKDKRPILSDLGLNKEVYKEFYEDKS